MHVKDQIVENYNIAKKQYSSIGVDTDEVLRNMKDIKISIHCWQGDDVKGFLNPENDLTGGILTTGNYKGAARTPDQLRKDIEFAISLIPGNHKINLHSIYLDTDEIVDLDEIEPKHFETWVKWAKNNKLGLDFNATFFSHPMYKQGMTLSHPDKRIREFWIEHGKRCRKIGEYIGKELGQTCYTNFWIPDGYKDLPIDRMSPRKRLIDSLDEIFKEEISKDYNIDTIESKLFGIGSEAYTVGSHEFYMGYGLTRGKTILLDAGHFHPTELISDKISALALFTDKLMLHLSRPMRWDSDHVIIMDDELQNIANELINNDLLKKTAIGLDFFDSTINRIAAWVVGTRNAQKAILKAMLNPIKELKKIENNYDLTKRLVYTEELKDFPYAYIWDYYCLMNNVPVGIDWFEKVEEYEREVLFNR